MFGELDWTGGGIAVIGTAVGLGLIVFGAWVSRTVSRGRQNGYAASRCPNAHTGWETPIRTTPHQKINGTTHKEIHSHE